MPAKNNNLLLLCASPLIALPMTHTPESNRKSKARYRECREWIRLAVEVVTLLIVGWYAVTNSLMYGEMVTANKQGKDAVAAAKTSADAAVGASRAWLIPIGQKANPVNGAFNIWIYFANEGKTPAIQIQGTEEYDVNSAREFGEGCESITTQWSETEAIKLPNEVFGLAASHIPSERGEKKRLLRIHGCVWYTDVITSTERSTEFCYMVTYMTNQFAVVIQCLPDPSNPRKPVLVFH
jgi:hypothetical protein